MSLKSTPVRRALGCVIAALAFGVAGCSNGSGSGDGSASSGAATAAAKLHGAPVKVMTIGPWTQPAFGTKNPEFPAGAQARVDAINAAGGLHGRPLELIVCSDESDPNVNRACAQKAVQEKVVAVVGLQNISGVAQPILAKAGIPAVGVVPFTPLDLGSNSFSDQGGIVAEDVGMIYVLKLLGARNVTQIWPTGFEIALVKQLQDQQAKKLGVTLHPSIAIPKNASDLTSVVAAATQHGEDGLAGLGLNEAALVTAIRQNAPGVKFVSTAFNLNDQVLKALGPNADGIGVALHTAPYSADVPGAKLFRADMAKYQPDLPLSNDGLHEWMAMWTFGRVVGKLDTITPATVKAAYGRIRDLDMGGITPPYSTVPHGSGPFARMFNPYVVPGVVKDQKIVPLNRAGDFINPLEGLGG